MPDNPSRITRSIPWRPYTAGRKARFAIAFAIFGIGLFLISTPAWLLKSAYDDVAKNAVIGLAGALIGYAVTGLVSELVNPTYEAVMEAFHVNSDEHYPESFRNLLRREVTAAVAEVTSSSVDFGPRANLFTKLAIRNTEETLRLQSISLSQKWQTTQILEDLFRSRPQLTVRILLIHPYSPHVHHREQDIGFREGTIRQLVEETILPLASLESREHIRERLQVRGYFATPYYGIISCDSARCLVTLSREGRGGDQNFGMLIEGSTQSSTGMISDLERGFDDRWEESYDLLQPLHLSLEVGENTPEGEFVVRITGDDDLDDNSLEILADNSQIISHNQVSRREIELRVRFNSDNGQTAKVQVTHALSDNHHRWLRARNRILLKCPGRA